MVKTKCCKECKAIKPGSIPAVAKLKSLLMSGIVVY